MSNKYQDHLLGPASHFIIRNNGMDAILIVWPKVVPTSISMAALAEQLQVALPWSLEVTLSEEAIQICYDVMQINYRLAKKQIVERIEQFDWQVYQKKQPPKLRIPICYHPSLAPDLERVLSLTGLSSEQFIQLHSRAEYSVSMIGFSPGFGYLKELAPAIQIPRLKSPRVSVPKGSVAIADKYTAIYPQVSPGGWSLVARTPISLFSPISTPPCMLSTGAKVKFDVIDLEEFVELEKEISEEGKC